MLLVLLLLFVLIGDKLLLIDLTFFLYPGTRVLLWEVWCWFYWHKDKSPWGAAEGGWPKWNCSSMWFFAFFGAVCDIATRFNLLGRRGWWGRCSTTFRLVFVLRSFFTCIWSDYCWYGHRNIHWSNNYLPAFVLSVFLVHIPWRTDLKVMLWGRQFILRWIVLGGKEIGYIG